MDLVWNSQTIGAFLSLLFCEKSELDMSMSGINIGARINKNIHNNLFIIHGVINSVIQGEDKCIDLQVHDLVQCFDDLWLED